MPLAWEIWKGTTLLYRRLYMTLMYRCLYIMLLHRRLYMPCTDADAQTSCVADAGVGSKRVSRRLRDPVGAGQRGAGGAARRGAAVCPTVLLQARHATGPGPREIWIGNNALVLMLVHDAKLYRRLYMPCIVYMYRRGRTDQLVVYNASKSCYRALVSLTRPVYN